MRYTVVYYKPFVGHVAVSRVYRNRDKAFARCERMNQKSLNPALRMYAVKIEFV